MEGLEQPFLEQEQHSMTSGKSSEAREPGHFPRAA